MRRLPGSPRLLALGFGCLLAVMPALAHAQTCPGKSSSSSTSSSGTSASASTSRSSSSASTSTQAQLTMIQNQIAQLELLLAQLQSGQTTPAASTGLTSAQAAQIVQQCIVTLRRLAAQLSSSGLARNQAANLRAARR